MTPDPRILLEAQARVLSFLASLTLDRIIAIVEGRARLTVVDAVENGSMTGSGPAPAVVPTPAPRPRSVRATRAPASSSPVNADEVVARLRACETVDQGTELLADLRLKKPDLQAVARFLGVAAGGTKDQLSRQILNLTVANRGKHAALAQG